MTDSMLVKRTADPLASFGMTRWGGGAVLCIARWLSEQQVPPLRYASVLLMEEGVPRFCSLGDDVQVWLRSTDNVSHTVIVGDRLLR
jgi:hypothetical protein